MIEGISPQIESILAAGNQAPSGENCQPWRFTVKGNQIEVHLIPERDLSYYNWGQRAAYLSIGTVLENMSIAATAVGFNAKVMLFLATEQTHIATVELSSEPAITPDPLAAEIFLRTTNRKRYLPVKPTDSEKRLLLENMDHSSGVTLHLVDERTDVKRLAEVGATNEEIMLSNEVLHDFFFSHLNWTKEEDDIKKIGFYIKTLELPLPAIIAFNILRYWPVMQALLRIHFEQIVAKQNAATYAASGGFGCISVSNDSPESFIAAGRLFERFWLRANKLGLGVQPLTGVLFFKLKIDGNEGAVFSPEHLNKIESEYKAAQKIFDCKGKRLVCMFRFGSGAHPTAHSSRFPLSNIVTVAST